MDLSEPSPDADHIRGRVLRFLVTRELERARQPMALPEIIERLERYGFTILGRASKTVSDSLRWEIAKGRVRRTGRGVYAYGTAPRSTLRRINRLSQAALKWVVAITRPQQREIGSGRPEYVPKLWDDYRWLWRI